ncbi:hypothetical protein FZEAL_4785 [Fusarium zealandicum]|uniref:Uncharacterized protein n=1 Tax=Fusarium zealandicum TaxID=1053134 RepID=A0A8H4UKZ3_9HYPO|nr:hypothetical protein FZEAL_4785 [Fusarium zealandicum]
MGHVDTKQAPHKGKPWTAVTSQDFIHKADLILPVEAYDAVHEQFTNSEKSPRYSKVTMTIGDVLQGDVLMLSEGKTTAGTLFTLRDGVLTMYLDKETYERAGLVGKPYGAKGGRGSKPRWIVSYNLRDPSMLRGKKGFDRLIYACKNALNQPMILSDKITHADPFLAPTPDPLQKFFPTAFTSSPGISKDLAVVQPSLEVEPEVLANIDREALEYTATEVYEWISLVRLGSPRVESGDSIDPYLSRYSVPWDADEKATVCKLSWQGFMSAEWLRGLLMDILVTCPSGTWFSLSATCFSKSVTGNGNDLTILRPPAAAGKYLMWETKASE